MSITLEQLREQRCVPRRGAEHALDAAAITERLALLPGWQLVEDGAAIARDFRFADFHQAMAFVDALAEIAHRENHHPDLEVGYGHCRVRFSTHDVGGLSENDFICAAQIGQLGC